MAELKIPQKTLQDNFNLQDFKDDFNALNSEIEENKTLTDSEISRLKEIANTWEMFKASGGAINGDIAIEKHLANLKIGDSFNIKTYDQNTELSSDWNKSIVLRIRSNATDSASYVRLNRANFAGNGNISLGEESTPWTNVYLKGVSKSQNGYTKLPNGMIMQWGRYNQYIVPRGTHTTEITMPIHYPNENLFSCANVNYNFAKGSDSHIEHINVSVNRVNSDKLKIKVMDVGNLDVETTFEVFWFSLGY